MKRKHLFLAAMTVFCIVMGMVLAGCEEEVTYSYKFINNASKTVTVLADGQTFDLAVGQERTITSSKESISAPFTNTSGVTWTVAPGVITFIDL